uniref:Serpentine Receptor, class T n=1 Tax=Panagrellus redivivus TaxID=6233 RepID=A0A7E4ZQP0_PANRE
MATYSCGVIEPFFLEHSVYLSPFIIISIVIAVFLDYVIITKSKDLGTFKYYILNQAIWAQLYEIVLIIESPVIFNNCLGAVFTGFLLRSIGSYRFTQILTIGAISLLGNTFAAVILSMVNRFLFVFTPSKRVYMDNKYTLTLIIVFIIIFHILFASAILLSSTDAETCKQLAVHETGDSLVKYFNEPSFYYAGENEGKTRFIGFVIFCMISFAVLPFAACIIVFIIHVVYNSKSLHSKVLTARSLVMVVTVQAMLCVCMVMFPTMWILASWTWNLNHDIELTNYVIILLSLHGIADAICTFYCVMPYRRYVISLFVSKKPAVPAPASNTSARISRGQVHG